MITLRPHHLLCIRKYTGHGYDARFTRHMDALVAELGHCPDTQIRLVRGCDDLCAVCPNNHGGSCESLQKVAAMDEAVLKAVGSPEGGIWQILTKRAEAVLNSETFDAICSNCSWYTLCKNTERGKIYEYENDGS